MLGGEQCPMWRKNRTEMQYEGVPDLYVKPQEYVTTPYWCSWVFLASQAFIATGYMIFQNREKESFPLMYMMVMFLDNYVY